MKIEKKKYRLKKIEKKEICMETAEKYHNHLAVMIKRKAVGKNA